MVHAVPKTEEAHICPCRGETQDSWCCNLLWVTTSGAGAARSGGQKPENRELWCPRAEEGCPSSTGREWALPSPFCSLQALSGLDGVHPHGWGWPSWPVFWLQCWSHPETPSQAQPEIMFYQVSEHPWAQSRWHVKLTIAINISESGT